MSCHTSYTHNRYRGYGVLCLVLLGLLFVSVLPLQAQVRQVDLREMVAASGMIFSGTVTEVRGAMDENGKIVTYTTFRIEKPIEGVMGGEVTIKLFGGEANGRRMYLAHMRYFSVGERMLVMLYPPSRLGFTSPIGMGQGAWKVTRDNKVLNVSGKVLQGLGTLLTKHNLQPRNTTSISLDTFTALIDDIKAMGGQ